MFEYPQVVIQSSGPDWLTVTGNGSRSMATLMEWANEVCSAYTANDEIVSAWKGLGYEGFRVGSLRFGTRKGTEAIVIMSGTDCLSLASEVPLVEGNVTRFDLQVTVCFSEPALDLARKMYCKLEAENETRERKRYIKFMESNTGQTAYIGKRTNSVMLRLYDKGDEANLAGPGELWRYEVEFKGASALRAYTRWLDSQNRPAYTAAQVWREFSKRGAKPLFDPSTEVSAISVGAKVSTLDSKLSWLVRCVSPVVAQLCLLGHSEAVFEALKLKHLMKSEGEYYGFE